MLLTAVLSGWAVKAAAAERRVAKIKSFILGLETVK
jgi:hypothetical protein